MGCCGSDDDDGRGDGGGSNNDNDDLPIACDLGAFSPADREREQALLAEHRAAVREIRELADGWAFRYPPDPAWLARAAELIALEHVCCPFLDFALAWPRGRTSQPWLYVTGAPSAKAFVRDTFTR